ncbi:hypothetical protein [Parasphingorhabdus pacifica]
MTKEGRMHLPAIRALATGELTSDQQRWLLDTLQLEETPRTVGPGAKQSLAHRSFTSEAGTTRLVLDLAHTGDAGWVLALFFDGERPSADTVEDYRRLFRDLVDQLGLELVEITPAATAEEVHVVPPSPASEPETAAGASWGLPYYELEQLWAHVGLRRDAPREVKEVKLREVMRTPAWSAAPPTLRQQAEDFLTGG